MNRAILGDDVPRPTNTKPEIILRSQNKSASLEMTIEAKKLFGDSIMNPNSNSRINQNDDEKYYGSGFSFRPDVLCDLDGKLRNWRKGLRLKTFS